MDLVRFEKTVLRRRRLFVFVSLYLPFLHNQQGRGTPLAHGT